MNPEFQTELQSLLNRHSLENGSDTPDFLLAQYLVGCLQAWNAAVCARERWYGREPSVDSTGPQEINLDR
jgi:hypothetical protein